MMTVRKYRRASLPSWAIGWITAVLMASGVELAAQETELTWVPQEKARIGVLLEEMCETVLTTADVLCDRPPVVTSVVVDGPADAAGVRARDTLLSVNGLDVTRTEGRELLLGFEAGVPVQLQVGRDGGRTTIEVTPELRPTEPYVEVRTFFGPPEDLPDGARSRVQVVRIPSVRTRLDEVEVRLDSMQAAGNDFVFFHQDSAGHFNIEVGDEKAHVLLERLREDESWPDRTGVSVWENEDLARRLTVVRDSSFEYARVRLDSLVRLRGQFEGLNGDSLGFSFRVKSGADPDGEWSYYVRPRAVPSQLRTLLLSDRRLGGAEFRQLSGDLAEYFDGADEGLLVVRVLRDTPAERMGLKDGDVVVEVDGNKCNNIHVLRDAIARAGSGGAVEVKWVRKGKVHVGSLDAR